MSAPVPPITRYVGQKKKKGRRKMVGNPTGASNGNRTRVPSLEGWYTSRCTTDAHIGGNKRTRTADPLLVRQMLSQLSYAPK